jgi:hypothetical protein
VRKQIHRDKEREADKLKLIAAIVRRAKLGLTTASKTVSPHRAQEIYHENKERLRELHKDLSALPLKDVRIYYDKLVSKKGIQDLHGMLQGERTGEAPRKHGMSEMETIHAAIQQSEGGPECAARSSGPQGSAPTSYDKPDAGDDGSASVKIVTPSRDNFDVLLDRAIEKMADALWLKNQTSCECGHAITCRQGLVNHLHERFEAGEKSWETADAYNELLASASCQLPGAAFASLLSWRDRNPHHADIRVMMTEVEEEDRQAGLKARRIERLTREARRGRLEANIVAPHDLGVK